MWLVTWRCPLPTRTGVACRSDRKWLIGIDIEPIEDEVSDFQDAFSLAERALLPTRERAYWATAFWCAKEAVGKAKGTLPFGIRRMKLS